MVELKASNAKSGESVHLGWYDNYKKAANAIIEEVRFGEADEPADWRFEITEDVDKDEFDFDFEDDVDESFYDPYMGCDCFE